MCVRKTQCGGDRDISSSGKTLVCVCHRGSWEYLLGHATDGQARGSVFIAGLSAVPSLSMPIK